MDTMTFEEAVVLRQIDGHPLQQAAFAFIACLEQAAADSEGDSE